MNRLRRFATGLLVLALMECHRAAPESGTIPATSAINLIASAQPPAVVAPADTSFARLIALLSEPGGFFDSDNIITNETSYLHVLDVLRAHGVHGGAYVGVGPDQNFSYVAAIQPRIAFIVDIRRDNLLEHLLFKALFATARNRIEYLALLVGKSLPADLAAWTARPVEDLIAHLDSARADGASVARARGVIEAGVVRFGLSLSPEDLARIERYRAQFVDEGLDVRFSSLGRNNASQYPTLRDLILETDRAGRQASFLASDSAFQFVKRMEAEDRIVPVVGDLAGAKAVRAIAAYLRAHDERVAAFYTSNVEQYLMRDGTFDAWAHNVEQLPRDARSVIIRSYFGGRFGGAHPLAMPGHTSTSMAQLIDVFAREYDAGEIRGYADLVGRGYLDR